MGMGTFPLRGENLRKLIGPACEMGVRWFDMADDYRNESDFGKAFREIRLTSPCIVQTKISPVRGAADGLWREDCDAVGITRAGIRRSLKNIFGSEERLAEFKRIGGG